MISWITIANRGAGVRILTVLSQPRTWEQAQESIKTDNLSTVTSGRYAEEGVHSTVRHSVVGKAEALISASSSDV